MLWIGAGLAVAAAVLLAYVPRLPSPQNPAGLGLAGGSTRLTPGTNRRLRAFATTQIAFSFVLLAGAGMLLATLVSLQAADTGYDMRHVVVFDIPASATGVIGPKTIDFYQEAIRRIAALPGVGGAAVGSFVPWRDAGIFGPGIRFTVEGYATADGEEEPRARFRMITPGFFSVFGVPMLAGRDFTDNDRADSEPVVIVSQSFAQRMFPNGEALYRHMWWTDPYFGKPVKRRIVGVPTDVDDENIVRGQALTVYHPVRQMGYAGRLFVHGAGDPHALVPAVTRVIRDISADQPVERAATLEDVRAEVLSPERLNAFVFSGCAGIALLIAAVGVAGVLAFSVSARTREFGVRLAVGAATQQLLTSVVAEGARIAALGIVAGALGGFIAERLAHAFVTDLRLPGLLPIVGAAGVLVVAAVVASLMPAARLAPRRPGSPSMGIDKKAKVAGLFYLLTFVTGMFAVVSGEIAANVISAAVYVVVSVLFYDLFKPVNRTLSLIAAAFSLMGCTVGTLDTVHVTHTGVNSFVFFGVYCLLIGYLIYRSSFLPPALGVLMAIAGLGWLTFVSPATARAVSPFNMLLGMIGEGALTLWLLIAGVNVARWNEQAGVTRGDRASIAS